MKILRSFLSVAALALLPCVAFASSITSATVYENTPDPGNASLASNMSSSLPYANFTVGSLGINFASDASYSIAPFLNNPVFSNMHNGFMPTGSLGLGNAGTELVITGFLTLNAGNNSFVLGHDDGAVLNVTGIGTVVNLPGPTAFSTTPFNVVAPTAGDYAFVLDFSECCSGPADLNFTINNQIITGNPPVATTPEPGSLVLLGTGTLALAGSLRKRLTR